MTLRSPVVLHTSWRGRFGHVLAPLILCGFGVVGLAGGAAIVPIVFCALGLALGLVAFLDFPIVVVVGPEGISRRCVFRTSGLTWDEVQAIARVSKSGGRSRSALGGLVGRSVAGQPGDSTTKSPNSGLVAEVSGRPYLLTDRIESRPEFDVLQAGMSEWCPGVALRASRPSDDLAATFVYKKRVGAGEDPFVDTV